VIYNFGIFLLAITNQVFDHNYKEIMEDNIV